MISSTSCYILVLNPHLHQSLDIITSPLFEPTSLIKVLKAWKCWSERNSTEKLLELLLILHKITHRWSMSSNICFAQASELFCSIYVMIHVTR